MSKMNLVLWSAGMALQAALLVLLVPRRIAGTFPFFSGLIGFYLLRSAGLVAFSHLLSRSSYALVFSGLGVADVLLQTAVTWELFSAARPYAPARRLAAFGGMMVGAAAFAVVAAKLIAASPRAPIDRSVVFSGALFLLVWIASLFMGSASLPLRILTGFAAYGGVGILCQMERTMAAAHRDAAGFGRWSYVEAAGYLAAIVYWICLLPRSGSAGVPLDPVPSSREHPGLASFS